jgi:integrase
MRLYKRCDCPETGCSHSLWYGFKHKGKPYRGSTFTANRKLALRIATRARNKVVGERAGLEMDDEAAPLQPLLSEARVQYINWAKGDHPATAESEDLRVLTVFQDILDDKRLDAYTPFDIERWRTARLKSGVVRNTVIRNTIVLQGFFSKARIWHKLKASPFDKVDGWKPDETKRLTLDDRQLHIAFTELPAPYCFVCRVTLESLARLSEVLGLQRTDLGPSWIQIKRKGGRVDLVTVSADLLADLRAWCPLDRKYVFANEPGDRLPMDADTASANMTREFRRIGLEGFSHHCFRHTGVTLMLENGVNPRAIQQLAGWSSLRQLARYGHARDAESRRAVEGNAAYYRKVMAQKPVEPNTQATSEPGSQ